MKKVNPSFIDSNNQIKVTNVDALVNQIEGTSIGFQETPLSNIQALEDQIRILKKENEELSKRIILTNKDELSELRKKLKKFENESFKTVSLSSLINENKEKTNSKSKLALFKRILEDNKKLR